MSNRTNANLGLLPVDRTEVRDRSGLWQVSFARLRAGVVTGTLQRGVGNVCTQSWRLFTTRDQFRACAEHEQLRFVDPLMHTQVMAEFDHVFDRPARVTAR